MSSSKLTITENNAMKYVAAILLIGGIACIAINIVQMCDQAWVDICLFRKLKFHLDAFVLFTISLGIFSAGVSLMTLALTNKKI